VCTCTTSETPVLAGSVLADGVHVNAVGAYTTTMRELDAEAVRRARVVVETREAAAAEAGDLALAIADGAIGPDHVVADLREVVRGARVRTSDRDVTLFESVGVAFEDLIVARAAVDRLGA
jgi:ornithine cyclodeaminase/alanine dehydrogenase-like protein (mu-crystallin family)